MAADMTEPFDSIQAGVWFEFTVYGAAVGDVYTVDLYASDFATILDTGYVYCVIPEPMTIAMLGLGALFLLRRRK